MSYITSMKYNVSLPIRDGLMEISMREAFIGTGNSKGALKKGNTKENKVSQPDKQADRNTCNFYTVWYSWLTKSFTARFL